MANIIEKLQAKPYQTRVKIMWSIVGISAAILVIIFVFSLRSTIKNAGNQKLVNISGTSTTVETDLQLAAVERIERTSNSMLIYFNFNNLQSDILNVSKLTDIKLSVGDSSITPDKITDRQGNPFVQKILSNTQNFGILYFSPVNDQTATLTFDQMFFEKTSSEVFKQTLNLNLESLTKDQNVRH